MSPETTINRASVLRALREFDRDLRNSPEWRGWDQKRSYLYALRHRGRRYPIKRVVAIAAGKQVNELYGGSYPGHANRMVEAAGFTVERLRGGNPDWTRDELIVALDFYLKHRDKLPTKQSEALAAVSRTLRHLASSLFPGEDLDDTFRNENSVYTKLMNFRRLDPLFTSKGGKGLQHGAKADETVWKAFADDPAKCAQVAAAIIAGISANQDLDSSESGSGSLRDGELDDLEEAEEGKLLSRLHRVRERDSSLAEAKRVQVLRERGALQCEVCGFDFAQGYPGRGEGFMECHHVQPLSSLIGRRRTRLQDLALLCANCHRMIHRKRPWLTLEQLRDLLKSPLGAWGTVQIRPGV